MDKNENYFEGKGLHYSFTDFNKTLLIRFCFAVFSCHVKRVGKKQYLNKIQDNFQLDRIENKIISNGCFIIFI